MYFLLTALDPEHIISAPIIHNSFHRDRKNNHASANNRKNSERGAGANSSACSKLEKKERKWVEVNLQVDPTRALKGTNLASFFLSRAPGRRFFG